MAVLEEMTPAELYNLTYMRIRPLMVTVPGIVLPHPYGGRTSGHGQPRSAKCSLVTSRQSDIHDVLMKRYLVLPSGNIDVERTKLGLTNASPLKIDDFRCSNQQGWQRIR